MYPRDTTVDSQFERNHAKGYFTTRERIACLHKEVFYPVQILKALRSENLQGSLASVTRIINKIQKTGSTESRPRSGRPTKLPADAKALIKKHMRTNDEATNIQIKKTTGQACNRCELLNCAKIASQTGIDTAAHPLLSTDKSS